MGPMTHEGTGNEPPDEFAHLFRPDSLPPDVDDDLAPDASAPEASPALTPHGGMTLDDPPLPVALEPEPEPAAPAEIAAPVVPPTEAKEGRLFRSRGAPERDDAITAVGSMQARRLRTMARGDEAVVVEDAAVVAVAASNVIVDEPVPVLPPASSGEPAPALAIMSGATRAATPAAREAPPRSTARPGREARERPVSGSLTALGVYAVTIGVTVILAFGETLFFGGEPGIITGIGLLLVSIFAAFTVRTYDGIHAIFAPAIAFFVASITAGQVGVSATGLTGRAVVVFFLLGGNWMWIVGSTVAALVIVALRRRVG